MSLQYERRVCRCEQVTKVKDSVLQLNQKDTDEINQPYHVVQVPPSSSLLSSQVLEGP